MATFKHSGNAGDILYSLYSIRSIKGKHTLYIALGTPAQYSGRVHPLGDVMCNRSIFNMLYPLLIATGLFNAVEVWKGEDVDFDLDKFRTANLDLGRGNITHWYNVVYPQLMPDTSEKLLDVNFLNELSELPELEKAGQYIAVNRTFRYRNADVRYKCLNDFDGEILFLGLTDEYEDFKLRVPNAIHRPVSDFLEAAMIIRCSRLFIGNQSMMFAIAEMLKHHRILEQYKHAPNVVPMSSPFSMWSIAINEQYLQKSLSLLLNGRNE